MHRHTQAHSQTTCHDLLTSPTVTEEKESEEKVRKKETEKARQMILEQLTRLFLMKIKEQKIRSLSFSLHS